MGGFIPPSPIDPSFTPTTSIVKLPSTASIDEIISILDRDGGLIITSLLTPSEISQIATDTLPYTGSNATPHSGIAIIPQETQLISGLVAKSPTMLSLCEHPILSALRARILTDEGSIPMEDIRKNWHIDPLLSLSVSFQIGYGAPRQRLHRDDGIHLVDHSLPYELEKVSQFACLVAGVETTRENGATMFVPGSHRWDEKRRPRLDEIAFAGTYSNLITIFLRFLLGLDYFELASLANDDCHNKPPFLSHSSNSYLHPNSQTPRNGTRLRPHLPSRRLPRRRTQQRAEQRPHRPRTLLLPRHTPHRREPIPRHTAQHGT